MNPLQKLNRLLQSNRSNWNIEVRRLIKEMPDYQDIEKVEYFPGDKHINFWDIHINGAKIGTSVNSSAAALQIANWLHVNKDKFNLMVK